MAVFRVERTRDYTVMSNYHLKDKRLTLKSKGLLSQMLSLPDDWDYTLSGLSVSTGRARTRSAPPSTSWRLPGISAAGRPPMPAGSFLPTNTSSMSVQRNQSRRRKTRQRKNR